MFNPTPFTIHKATLDDLAFLRKIDKIGCEHDGIVWTEDREPLLLTFASGERNFALIAYDGSRSIAAILGREGNTSDPDLRLTKRELLVPRIGEATRYIEPFELWVHPEYRRNGIASKLKSMFEDECRARSIEWIFTFQHFENLPAITMNEKLGYEHIGIRTMWDDVPRICFLRRVPSIGAL